MSMTCGALFPESVFEVNSVMQEHVQGLATIDNFRF